MLDIGSGRENLPLKYDNGQANYIYGFFKEYLNYYMPILFEKDPCNDFSPTAKVTGMGKHIFCLMLVMMDLNG